MHKLKLNKSAHNTIKITKYYALTTCYIMVQLDFTDKIAVTSIL